MEEIKLSNIPEQTKNIIEPFFRDVLSQCNDDVISICLTGSVVTKDFNPKHSDINTLLVVKEVKIPFFDFISSLGKRYSKKRIRAPLIMTRDYIGRTLDVFPLEFLEMKLIHQLIYGVDVLKGIPIEKKDVRLQCERELKGKLENLCQCYIKAMGDKTTLMELFFGSLSGYFPVFRGILFLYDKNIPREKGDVLCALKESCNMEIDTFIKLLSMKSKNMRPSLEELKEIFKDMYHELDVITHKIDEYGGKHA